MSKLIEPVPVRMFVGIIYNTQSRIKDCINQLESEFGSILLSSPIYDFNGTDYYESEMGKILYRKFISFQKLIKRDEIVEIKLFTNMLEEKHSTDSNKKRTINLDPGYLAPEHLILATGKGYYHRPYLGKGVYADLTLAYQGNSFKTFEWTYPDYKFDYIQKFFLDLRDNYLSELKDKKVQ